MTDQTERNFSTLGDSLEMSCSKKEKKKQNTKYKKHKLQHTSGSFVKYIYIAIVTQMLNTDCSKNCCNCIGRTEGRRSMYVEGGCK